MSVTLPALTAALALVMSIALIDQWRDRRQPFQLVWAIGMAFYGIAAGLRGHRRRGRLERGAVPDLVPDRRGPDRRLARARHGVLLARTRFGYAVAVSIFLAGLFTLLTQAKYHYEGAGSTPILYFIGAGAARAGDRRRDVLPERALAALRGDRGRRGEPPRPVPDDHRDAPPPGFRSIP